MAKSISTVQQTAPATRGPGRPKGSLNKKTIQREIYREAAIDLLGENLKAVAEKVIAQAIDGCRKSQKMILDRALPAAKAVDHTAGDPLKEINISFSTFTGETKPFVEPIEGNYSHDD